MRLPVDAVTLYEERHEVSITCGGEDYLITQADFVSLGLTEDAETDTLAFLAEKLACIKKSLSYLSLSDISTRKLREKLKDKFSEECINEVIDMLVEKGYLDDSRLAIRFASELASSRLWGRARIKEYLYSKGFSREDINTALEELDDEEILRNLDSLIMSVAKKYDVADKTSRAKFGNALYRYGYSWDEITPRLRNYIETLINEINDD